MDPIVLRDDALLLSPYQMSDVDDLYEAARESIEQVGPWLPWCHADYSKAESEEWIGRQIENWRDDREFAFAVRGADTGRFLGGCGLNHRNLIHRFANLGYWVRTSDAGRGIAARAAGLVAQFGFRDVGLQRIEIVVAIDNQGSHRVAQKLGALHEGVLRNRLFGHGEVRDAAMYSLVPRVAGDGT